MAKPILKWVGGKTKLLKELYSHTPRQYSTYIEPFIGGGALFFSLGCSKSIINDANSELINFYNQVRVAPTLLLNTAKKIDNLEETYYAMRNKDRGSEWISKVSDFDRAVRFFYLNRASFNGLWRVNSSGHMNTPYGKYDKIAWPTESHMIRIFERLTTTNIFNMDFYKLLTFVDEKTFVYLDPPYIPYSDTSNFTGYSSGGFGMEDQARLVKFCQQIDKRGGKFLVSNSDTLTTRNLFYGYHISAIDVYHSVGSSAESRKEKGEVLIKNYSGQCVGLFL